MKTITLRIPDGGSATFDYAVYLASKLYEDAVVTAGLHHHHHGGSIRPRPFGGKNQKRTFRSDAGNMWVDRLCQRKHSKGCTSPRSRPT